MAKTSPRAYNRIPEDSCMTTLNIPLPEPMRQWVEEQVRDGEYADAGEYVLDLIREDRERREALLRALVEGEESGISSRPLNQIIADAKVQIRNGTL
jgi:antitoxin ParD1/3/4